MCRILRDQINNFRNISEDGYWPSWKRGEEKRQKIMELLKNNPNPSITEIAQHCEISISQAKRHRTNMIASGLWKVCGCVIVISSSFITGVYYASDDSKETLDEIIESRIKSPIHNLEEEILWKLEQKFL
jgi:hypothetical protein